MFGWKFGMGFCGCRGAIAFNLKNSVTCFGTSAKTSLASWPGAA